MSTQIKHVIVSILVCSVTSLCAAQSDTQVGKVVNGVGSALNASFYGRWMYDQNYLNELARDPNPEMQVAKAAVVGFEAETGRSLVEGHFNEQIDGILQRDLADEYVQHDPNIPQGRDGLAKWMKAGGMHKGSGMSSPPVPIALTADPSNGFVTMILEMEPQPVRNDPLTKYPGYLISVFRVKNGKLTEHFSQSQRGTYYCRIGCGPKARAAH